MAQDLESNLQRTKPTVSSAEVVGKLVLWLLALTSHFVKLGAKQGNGLPVVAKIRLVLGWMTQRVRHDLALGLPTVSTGSSAWH